MFSPNQNTEAQRLYMYGHAGLSSHVLSKIGWREMREEGREKVRNEAREGGRKEGRR